MRILHAPINIAGQPAIISRAQRKCGVTSDVLVYDREVYNYPDDIDLELQKRSTPGKVFTVLANFFSCLVRYDVFHFHYGKGLLPRNWDLPILRLFGKTVVMHYWGSDVIQVDVALQETLLDEAALKRIIPGLDDNRKRDHIAWVRRHVHAAIVGDYSLLPYAPGSIVVRQAVDLGMLPFAGTPERQGPVKIIHAPTNREFKGTKFIIAAIDRLKGEGYAIDFVIVENTPHAKALGIFREADIIVDDVLQGPYGIFAIECMALGKPVVCRMNEKLLHYYTGLPIVNANPDTLYEVLRSLAGDPARRRELGLLGRRYVEEVHDAEKIAKQLIGLYTRVRE